MNEKNPDPAKTNPKLSLAELLARSLDDDMIEETQDVEKERWDDDEGSFGG